MHMCFQDTETRLKCRTKTRQRQDPMNWWFWNDSCPNEVTLNLILWCPTWLDQLTFVDGKYWKDSDWLLPATRNNKVENKALLNLPPPGIWQAWSYSLEDFMQKLILTAARPHYYRRIISRKIFKLVDDWEGWWWRCRRWWLSSWPWLTPYIEHWTESNRAWSSGSLIQQKYWFSPYVLLAQHPLLIEPKCFYN